MRPRFRRRLRVAGLRALRVARRHHVTALSAIVLAAAAGVALTSTSFDVHSPAPGAGAQAVSQPVTGDESATVPATPADPTPAPGRRLAIVYLVQDEAQGSSVIETYSMLVWDHRRPDDTPPPMVRYLVAGTREAESLAIQNLNYYIELADLHRFDLQVIDLRP